MSKMMVKRLLILCGILISTMLYANNEIELLYFNHGDSVSLRWSPADISLLRTSVNRGYVVQRKQSHETLWQTISPLLKPMSDSELEKLQENVNDALVLRELFYQTAQKEYEQEDAEPESLYRAKLTSVEGKPEFEEQLLFPMSLLSCDIYLPIAKAAALHYVDIQVEKTARYDYRVVWGGDEDKSNPAVRVVSVDMSKKTILPQLSQFDAHFDEEFVQLEWSVENSYGFYSAYIVERSTDSIHFERVSPRPFIHAYTEQSLENTAIYRDSLLNDEERFYYRICGYSPFGLLGPKTKIIGGEALFNIHKIDLYLDTVVLNKRNAEITWSMSEGFEKKIKGFRINRTDNFKEFDYIENKMLKPSQRSFKVSPIPDKSTYFSVDAIGLNGDVKRSNRFYLHHSDSVPPAIPEGLSATIDSLGNVSVKWNKNKDEDILGYQLYFSNSGKENDYYNVMDTIYKDTIYNYSLPLNTLTNEIFYKVLSLDNSYNQSYLSEAVKLLKPDTLPPTKALFDFPLVGDESIELNWVNSTSEDVYSMMLLRQIDDNPLDTLKIFKNSPQRWPTSFVDKSEFLSGVFVQYFLVVYDEVGNKNESHTKRIKMKGLRPCITGLSYTIFNNDKERKIRLKWEEAPNAPKIKRFVVYRKVNDEAILPIASVNYTDMFYDDFDVVPEKHYFYIIRPVSTEMVCPALDSDNLYIEPMLE